MKTLLLTLGLIFQSSLGAAAVIEPQSDDVYQCVDSVSGFIYDLKIIDIGDEHAIVSVRNGQGALLRVAEDVELDESSGGLTFVIWGEDQQFESISFENYDLDQAVYTDGGDSRPMSCRQL